MILVGATLSVQISPSLELLAEGRGILQCISFHISLTASSRMGVIGQGPIDRDIIALPLGSSAFGGQSGSSNKTLVVSSNNLNSTPHSSTRLDSHVGSAAMAVHAGSRLSRSPSSPLPDEVPSSIEKVCWLPVVGVPVGRHGFLRCKSGNLPYN